jgi:hypothetical protein
MKRKGFLLLVLAALVAGGAFAQKVGDTVQVGGKDYRVEEVRNDGYLGLRPAPTIEGVWVYGSNVITISGNGGVFTEIVTTKYKDAQSKGWISVGGPALRNIRSTNNQRWSCQNLGVYHNSNNPNVAISTRWDNVEFALSADGQSLAFYNPGEKNPYGTWTRRK